MPVLPATATQRPVLSTAAYYKINKSEESNVIGFDFPSGGECGQILTGLWNTLSAF